MPATKQLTRSQRRARLLLAAWNSGVSTRVREAVEQAAPGADARTPWSEVERLEMLQEVASTIGSWMNGTSDRTALDAALGLLRHLAGAPPEISREAVRFEMLACVPRSPRAR